MKFSLVEKTSTSQLEEHQTKHGLEPKQILVDEKSYMANEDSVFLNLRRFILCNLKGLLLLNPKGKTSTHIFRVLNIAYIKEKF